MGNSQSISQQRQSAMQNYVDFDGQELDVKDNPIPEKKNRTPDYLSILAIVAIIGGVIYTISASTKN